MNVSRGDREPTLLPALPSLGADERAVYEWQMWIDGLGESGQRKLKGASVLVSRCGGVGGAAATYLAAAGVGRLVIAHAGDLRPSDLNRQTLMTHNWIGRPRVELIRQRLLALSPRLTVETWAENASEANADRLVSSVDWVVDAAPMFQERHALNAAAVRHRKPMTECAMFETELHVTTIVPGRTACLACRYPGIPPEWKRQFPVLGAVAGTAGTLGATEVIKGITGLGEMLTDRLLVADLLSMKFRTLRLHRDPACGVCGGGKAAAGK
ncbi:MAG TPA: HesA/MoeB/ThiF family protein [Tepidisphaeraceae bacterium]|nr:HesA/MoeB/ThiF family protein [Tepidisphaeraceae bacterium]